ncbi:Epoxide hydrolase 4 [Halotydeus destructor]|nr:Epoxide hydrolase 4 [Halotydeus destructor]
MAFDMLFVYAWALFFAGLNAIVIIISIVLKKGKVIKPKKRTEAPAAWNEPELGIHHFIEVNDVRLHYVCKGDPLKPMVLFLHGFPECWYSWRKQLRELNATDHFLVAMDMRGYGESDKPASVDDYHWTKLVDDVKQVVDVLGNGKATVVSHDWGGIVAWLFAAKYPEAVDKLVSINGPHPTLFSEIINSSWSQHFKSYYMYVMQLPYATNFTLRLNDFAFLNRVFVGSNGQQLATDEEIEVYKYSLSNKANSTTGPINYYKSFFPIVKTNPTSFPGRVNCKTLIIWGKDDKFLSRKLVDDIDKYCPNVEKHMVDAGHFVAMEKPAVVNDLLEKFLRSDAKI